MKNINWKNVALPILPLSVVSIVVGQMDSLAAERADASESASTMQTDQKSQIRLVVSSQDAGGTTQDQLDLTFLKNLEAYTVARTKTKMKEYFASIGQPNIPINITSEAIYVQAGSIKLAIIRLKDAGSRQVIITGIVGKELKRVGCIRETAQDIPVSYGPCADKIEETFGAKIGGQ